MYVEADLLQFTGLGKKEMPRAHPVKRGGDVKVHPAACFPECYTYRCCWLKIYLSSLYTSEAFILCLLRRRRTSRFLGKGDESLTIFVVPSNEVGLAFWMVLV